MGSKGVVPDRKRTQFSATKYCTVRSGSLLCNLRKNAFRDFFQKFMIFVAFNLWKEVFRDFLEQNQAIFRVLPLKIVMLSVLASF
jgi:hypothetical protein